MKLIDSTPVNQGCRGSEILTWLERHKAFGGEVVESFVVIDDNSDMEGVFQHFVQTNGQIGITLDNALAAVRVLRGGV